jgi:hypothetical protein
LGWQAWLGGKVIDGLCDLLDEHLDEHKEGDPAVIGCVPWFDSSAVEDRLLKMRACSVVIDKGLYLPGRLVRADTGFPNNYLSGVQWTTANADEDGAWVAGVKEKRNRGIVKTCGLVGFRRPRIRGY